MKPGNEGERFYCPRCVRSQNICTILLAIMATFVMATGGHSKILYIMLIGWACSLVWWVFSYIVYRVRLARYQRELARYNAAQDDNTPR